MKSSTGFTRWGFSASANILLIALLLSCGMAWGFPFFGKKTQAAESLPPQVQSSPHFLNPQDVTQLGPGEPAKPNGSVALPPEAPPWQILQEQGLLPQELIERDTPLTRAEFADIFIRVLGHRRTLFSEFPFYRDVPIDHWAYVPIEIARHKRLIDYPDNHGFYQPEANLIYQEVYQAFANAIAGNLKEEALDPLLEPFEGQASWPDELRRTVAKLVRSKFFESNGKLATGLRFEEPVTAKALAPLLKHFVRVVAYDEDYLLAREEQMTVLLPAGWVLSITPINAIVEANLQVGRALGFSLLSPVGFLPKGSRLQGMIRAADPANRTYSIELTEVQTPEDEYFQTSAELQLRFDTKDKLAFIVPGEIFEVVTRIPAIMTSPETTTIMPEQPPGPPAGSSGNTWAPNSARHSPK